MKIAQSQSYSNNLNFRANLVCGGNNNDHLKDFAQNPKQSQIDLIEKTGDKNTYARVSGWTSGSDLTILTFDNENIYNKRGGTPPIGFINIETQDDKFTSDMAEDVINSMTKSYIHKGEQKLFNLSLSLPQNEGKTPKEVLQGLKEKISEDSFRNLQKHVEHLNKLDPEDKKKEMSPIMENLDILG